MSHHLVSVLLLLIEDVSSHVCGSGVGWLFAPPVEEILSCLIGTDVRISYQQQQPCPHAKVSQNGTQIEQGERVLEQPHSHIREDEQHLETSGTGSRG